MNDPKRFEERYRTGNTPWDHGAVDFNLVEMVADRPIAPCQAIDVGCGTGDNAIWLARQGFEVSACDISPTAVEEARRRAQAAGAECSFCVLDFLGEDVPGGPFGIAFDRGCGTTFPDPLARGKPLRLRSTRTGGSLDLSLA